MSRVDDRRAKRRRRKKRNGRIGMVVLALLLLVLIGAVALVGHALSLKEGGSPAVTNTAKSASTITVGSVGDIIIHDPFLRSGVYKKSNGEYDFSPCFKFMKDLYEEQSYMVANMETTLSGKSAKYSGYPLFNSPDSLADALHDNGVDLMLLANNHIYDKGKSGFLRTVQVLQEKGYDYTGARNSDDEEKYLIKDIDGIKVGFINYTYETPSSSGKAINGNHMDDSVAGYLNSFKPSNADSMYESLKKQVAIMKLQGAEFIIFYPHWGEEYKMEAYGYTKTMAQKVCNIGVDAIIGGHPHVVEPIDVLTSDDGKKKTLVAYSMGNQLSNQRREMISSLPTGNTEDGIMVNLEISRDDKGHVELTGLEVIPTWVYKKGQEEPTYYIIPLNDIDNVESMTGISGIKASCQESSKRTHKIIDSGLKKVQEAYGF